MSAEEGGTTGPEKPTGLALFDAGKSADGADEAFRRSIASLSRQLAAVRSAEGASPIGTRPKNRQVDLALDEPVSLRPVFKVVLAFALGVAVSIVGIYTFQAESPPTPTPVPSPPVTTTMATGPTSTPSRVPEVSPPPLSPPSPPAGIDAAATVQPLPAAAAPPVPAAPAPSAGQTELSAAEVLELQTRLESLGMSPGFLDGIPGPRTAAAVRRYEEARGQPSTGTLDRQLLQRLREEGN